MNNQERADANLDAKGMVSIAAALTAVGLTLKVETPLWPAALGEAPSLGLVVTILGVLLAAAHYTLLWWRDLDETDRQAHRRAWWVGGNLGMAGGAVALFALLGLDRPLTPPLFEDSVAWGATGFLCLLGGQAVGYGLALLAQRQTS